MTLRLALCLGVIAVGVGLHAQGPGGTPTESGARPPTDRATTLEAESDRLAAQARALLAELRGLEAERDRQVALVQVAREAVGEGQAAIDETAKRLLALDAQRVAELPAIEAQLVDMYKHGRTGYAKLLLTAGGIRDFGRASRTAAAMLRLSQERVARYRATMDTLRRERLQLESELDARRTREADARQAQAAADRAVADLAALLARIDAQRDVNARLAGELRVEQARLARLAPSTPGPTARAAEPPESVTSPLTPFKGKLLWPVSGRVIGRFGRKLGAQEDAAAAGGIEVASRAGNPVRALHAGTVTFAGPSVGLGNMVIVDHGSNTLSLYGFLGAISVNRGASVEGGTELGRVGEAPAGDAKLFLELRVDGRSVDPVQWLGAF